VVAPPQANPEAQRAGALIPPGKPVALPMVVTDQYENRGWFGDADIVARFAGSDMIRETVSAAGPCAARVAGARGKCLQYTFTPPAERMVPPAGGFVGDFMLTTLAFFHPEAAPTPRPGDANWGYEPAVTPPPGATRVSFYAAAPQPVTVTFRAGGERDQFVVPGLTRTLTPAWQQYSISLEGVSYGHNVFGPFGWSLEDTSAAATFFVDGIVWEGSGAAPSVTPAPRPVVPPVPAPPADDPAAPRPAARARNGVREIEIINQCQQTVWVGTFGDPVPADGGFRLDPGQTRTVTVPAGVWTGRFWGRTGCRFNAAGVGSCESGSCGARERCPGSTGQPPASLAEFTLEPTRDIYDVSLVDGFNLPMAIVPVPGTFSPAGTGDRFDCGAPVCARDINTTCPAHLRFSNADGKVVGCLSGCERFRTSELCCSGPNGSPDSCPPTDHARFFKTQCPGAYSFAYDDRTSTFACRGEDYAVYFCP
jgi:hypothetical protein